MIEPNNIYLGNSYELIKEIPDKSIDCIYTDIPYLFTHGQGGAGALSNRVNRLMKEELYSIKDGIDYSILDEFVRVMKNVNIFIWCSKQQIIDIMNYFNKKDISYEILTWNKTNPIPMTDNTWLPDTEYCLYFREKGKIKLNGGYDLKHKYYISAINKADKDKYGHPTIKPLELVKKHLLHATNEGGVILDTFMGSGTTCVACRDTNRKYIGFEINEQYFKIAQDRLNGIEKSGQVALFQ